MLLIHRFDRDPLDADTISYGKARMVSALTVLDGEEMSDRKRWSYLALSDELQRWSARPKIDRAELFRRVVLNALVTNTDDHPRNHAFLAVTADWRLSPVYDVTPNPVHSHERDLAMVCGVTAGRRASRANLLSGCTRFGLTQAEAEETIEQMRTTIAASWETAVRAHGGSAADCEAIRPAFEIPGFDAAL